MANHLRRQAREGFVTTVTGLATTGANVFDSPKHPLAETDLPALRVSAGPESIDSTAYGGGTSARTVQRFFTVKVEIIVQDNDAIEDTVDGIAKEVEIAIANNQSLGCGMKWVQLREVSEPEISDNAEQPMATATMQFQVFYLCALNAPDVAL